MIKKIEQIKEFDEYTKLDVYSVRIKSLLNAYGCKYDFASFYCQLSQDDRLTAIISKLDNDFTLSFTDNCDMNELCEFFSVIGYSTILADSRFTFNSSFNEGIVMVTDIKKEIGISNLNINFFPDLMDIFTLSDYENTDFKAWYVDANHRIRHNCAKAASIEVDGITVSSAMFSSIYNNNAILTSVKTLPDYRNNGYATTLICEMISDINGKVFLMREKNKNQKFYENLGFKDCGEWRLYK